MKLSLVLLALSLACATTALNSCAAAATAAVLNEASNDSERKAFDEGYMMGRKDAKAGRKNNYGKYSTMYTSATKSAFQRGYQSGYIKGS